MFWLIISVFSEGHYGRTRYVFLGKTEVLEAEVGDAQPDLDEVFLVVGALVLAAVEQVLAAAVDELHDFVHALIEELAPGGHPGGYLRHCSNSRRKRKNRLLTAFSVGRPFCCSAET
jgi:hypothetical protein